MVMLSRNLMKLISSLRVLRILGLSSVACALILVFWFIAQIYEHNSTSGSGAFHGQTDGPAAVTGNQRYTATKDNFTFVPVYFSVDIVQVSPADNSVLVNLGFDFDRDYLVKLFEKFGGSAEIKFGIVAPIIVQGGSNDLPFFMDGAATISDLLSQTSQLFGGRAHRPRYLFNGLKLRTRSRAQIYPFDSHYFEIAARIFGPWDEMNFDEDTEPLVDAHFSFLKDEPGWVLRQRLNRESEMRALSSGKSYSALLVSEGGQREVPRDTEKLTGISGLLGDMTPITLPTNDRNIAVDFELKRDSVLIWYVMYLTISLLILIVALAIKGRSAVGDNSGLVWERSVGMAALSVSVLAVRTLVPTPAHIGVSFIDSVFLMTFSVALSSLLWDLGRKGD